MGSEQNARNGLKRRGDGAAGYATQYTIVDLDIGADDLIRRYDGTKRAAWIAEVIRGVVQRQRTKEPPSDDFIRMMRRARSVPAITIIDLGLDAKGKNWCVVHDGRQRNMAQREIDKSEEEAGRPRRFLDCDYFVPSAKTPREDVIFYRVATAMRVQRTPSALAEDAADLREQRYADDDIAPLVEQKDAAGVALLIALHGCADEVKAAVDGGRYPLADVAALAKFPHEEQVRRVTRATAAPKGERTKDAKAARDAAAPARPKARPARMLESVENELRGMAGALPGYEEDDEVARCALIHGAALGVALARGVDVGELPDWLRKAMESAATMRKVGRAEA